MEALQDEAAAPAAIKDRAATFDRLLSSGPFGDTAYVRDANGSVTRTLLDFCPPDDRVVAHLRANASLLDSQALLSPQLRYAVARGMAPDPAALRSDGLPLDGWLPARGRRIAATRGARALSLPVFFPGDERDAAAVLAAIYDKEVPPVDSPSRATIIDPPPDIVEGIAGGLELLAGLLPKTASSCFDHVSLVGVYSVDGKVRGKECDGLPYWESVSTPAIPGAVFAFSAQLAQPWLAAEALFHEAIHCKLFDLYNTPGLLAPDYDCASAACVVSDWNESFAWRTNVWPFDQALGALHVYVHLLALFTLAGRLSHSAAVAAHIDARRRAALVRSGSIETQMRPRVAEYMTADGAEFFEWLCSCRRTFTS